jgi:tRNA pseudouridine38-40 synthase
MTRWKLTIEYDGSGYAGWQRQDSVLTVQGEIEAAIAKFTQQEIPVFVAGRTDAGVHACGQVAHVDLPEPAKPMQGFEVAKAINAHLQPRPISVIKAETVAEDFHARYGALSKLYRYRIANRSGMLALDRGRAWHCKKPLDVMAMQQAAQHLIGHHDFSTFRDSECQAKSPIKTLDRAEILTFGDYEGAGREIVFETEAQSFLHHMVRNMVGSLVMVGEGKWSPQDLKAALEARDRREGGMTAPPDGLYLMRVDYPL